MIYLGSSHRIKSYLLDYKRREISLIDYDTHIIPLKYRDKWLGTMKIKLIIFEIFIAYISYLAKCFE